MCQSLIHPKVKIHNNMCCQVGAKSRVRTEAELELESNIVSAMELEPQFKNNCLWSLSSTQLAQLLKKLQLGDIKPFQFVSYQPNSKKLSRS